MDRTCSSSNEGMLQPAVMLTGTIEGGREGSAGEPCTAGAGAGICGEGDEQQAAGATAATSPAAAAAGQRQQDSGAKDREWMLVNHHSHGSQSEVAGMHT